MNLVMSSSNPTTASIKTFDNSSIPALEDVSVGVRRQRTVRASADDDHSEATSIQSQSIIQRRKKESRHSRRSHESSGSSGSDRDYEDDEEGSASSRSSRRSSEGSYTSYDEEDSQGDNSIGASTIGTSYTLAKLQKKQPKFVLDHIPSIENVEAVAMGGDKKKADGGGLEDMDKAELVAMLQQLLVSDMDPTQANADTKNLHEEKPYKSKKHQGSIKFQMNPQEMGAKADKEETGGYSVKLPPWAKKQQKEVNGMGGNSKQGSKQSSKHSLQVELDLPAQVQQPQQAQEQPQPPQEEFSVQLPPWLAKEHKKKANTAAPKTPELSVPPIPNAMPKSATKSPAFKPPASAPETPEFVMSVPNMDYYPPPSSSAQPETPEFTIPAIPNAMSTSNLNHSHPAPETPASWNASTTNSNNSSHNGSKHSKSGSKNNLSQGSSNRRNKNKIKIISCTPSSAGSSSRGHFSNVDNDEYRDYMGSSSRNSRSIVSTKSLADSSMKSFGADASMKSLGTDTSMHSKQSEVSEVDEAALAHAAAFGYIPVLPSDAKPTTPKPLVTTAKPTKSTDLSSPQELMYLRDDNSSSPTGGREPYQRAISSTSLLQNDAKGRKGMSQSASSRHSGSRHSGNRLSGKAVRRNSIGTKSVSQRSAKSVSQRSAKSVSQRSAKSVSRHSINSTAKSVSQHSVKSLSRHSITSVSRNSTTSLASRNSATSLASSVSSIRNSSFGDLGSIQSNSSSPRKSLIKSNSLTRLLKGKSKQDQQQQQAKKRVSILESYASSIASVSSESSDESSCDRERHASTSPPSTRGKGLGTKKAKKQPKQPKKVQQLLSAASTSPGSFLKTKGGSTSVTDTAMEMLGDHNISRLDLINAAWQGHYHSNKKNGLPMDNTSNSTGDLTATSFTTRSTTTAPRNMATNNIRRAQTNEEEEEAMPLNSSEC